MTLTSTLFVIPAIYGYSCGLYFLALFIAGTSIISANYWRNPVPGIRRDLDLVYSKVSFCIFLLNGIYYVRSFPAILVFYPGLGCMIWSFYTSNAFYYQKKEFWWKYHMIFHGTVIITQFTILSSKSYVLQN